jgi:hypothetical protein
MKFDFPLISQCILQISYGIAINVAINLPSISHQSPINLPSISHQSPINLPSISHQSPINLPSISHQFHANSHQLAAQHKPVAALGLVTRTSLKDVHYSRAHPRGQGTAFPYFYSIARQCILL